MMNWLRCFPRHVVLAGIPAHRRHAYFLATLFLVTAAADNAWNEFNQTRAAGIDLSTVDELVRLEEMAATASALYEGPAAPAP